MTNMIREFESHTISQVDTNWLQIDYKLTVNWILIVRMVKENEAGRIQ